MRYTLNLRRFYRLVRGYPRSGIRGKCRFFFLILHTSGRVLEFVRKHLVLQQSDVQVSIGSCSENFVILTDGPISGWPS